MEAWMEPLQVIAAPRRLRILELVWDRELSAGEIAAQFDVSWSAISQHVSVLKQAGFVLER
jgi:DNA-binding transcriptional ArsR family regulator